MPCWYRALRKKETVTRCKTPEDKSLPVYIREIGEGLKQRFISIVQRDNESPTNPSDVWRVPDETKL